MGWKRRAIVVLSLAILLSLLTATVAYASAADVYAKSKYYKASTYSGHPSLSGFGTPLDLNGCTSTGGFVEDNGWPIYAPGPGTVAVKTTSGGWGNSIIWTSKDGKEQIFMAHLSRFGAKGTVAGGAIIGYVGNTGTSYGAHIHAQRRYNGAPAALQLSGKTIVAGGRYLSKGPDSVAPTGSFTSPAADSIIVASGTTALTGTFTDAFGIAKVSFYWRYYDEPSTAYRLIGTDTTAGSDGKTYGVSWTHSLPKARRIVIKAIPSDRSGNVNNGITRAVWTQML